MTWGFLPKKGVYDTIEYIVIPEWHSTGRIQDHPDIESYSWCCSLDSRLGRKHEQLYNLGLENKEKTVVFDTSGKEDKSK